MFATVKAFFVKFLYFLPYFLLATVIFTGIPFLARNLSRITAWFSAKIPGGAGTAGLMIVAGLALGFALDSPLAGMLPFGLLALGPMFYIGEEKVIELERQGAGMVVGQNAVFKCPLSYLYKEFFVCAETTLTGAVAVPVLTQDVESRMMARIILRNGKRDLINGSGRILRYWNEYENRVAADVVSPAAAAAAMVFDHTWNLRCYDPFAMPDIREREYLRSWAMSKLEVEVQLGVLADMGAAGGGGTLVWNGSDVRVFAVVIEVSDKEKSRLDKTNVLGIRLGWDQEVSAGGFAADHQFRTANLNRDGACLRIMAMSRTGAPPADIRADNVVHLHSTFKEKPVTPLQIPGLSTQQIRTQSGMPGFNQAVGLYMLDLDTEGNHIGMPIPGSSDDLSLWYQYPVVAGGVLEVLQQSLVAAGYDV